MFGLFKKKKNNTLVRYWDFSYANQIGKGLDYYSNQGLPWRNYD